MKIKIVRSNFIEGLKLVQNIVSAKNSLPILQNVLLEAETGLRLLTTDLDISIMTQLECNVVESGKTTLPVKLLFAIVSKLPEGEIEITVDETDTATIKAGSALYKLNGKNANDYPRLDNDEQSNEYTILRSVFNDMLRKTYYAMSQDDSRRALKGLLLSFKNSILTMVSADGKRLAKIESGVLHFDQETDVILPAKTVFELMRIIPGNGDVKIFINSNRIYFKIDNAELHSKLIDEVYPNYRHVIPSKFKYKISIDTSLLLEAIERVCVIAVNEANSIRLIFDSNQLTITSATNEVGNARDTVPIKYTEEHLEVVLDPKLLLPPLKALDDDEIFLNINDGYSPSMITCSVPFLHVLMPLR